MVDKQMRSEDGDGALMPYVRPWQIYLCWVALTIAIGWFAQHSVLTRELYHRLLGGQLEASRIDALFDAAQTTSMWGYLMAPLSVAIRCAFVTMVLQLVLLIDGVETPSMRIGRVVLIAYGTVVWQQATKVAYLATLRSDQISNAVFSVTPGSVNALLPISDYQSPLFALLGAVSGFELVWVVTVSWGLARVVPMQFPKAFVRTFGVWTTLTLLFWSINWYVTHVLR
jgi:hypothetical protein